MNFNRLFVIFLLLNIGILNAQTDFKPGYIIKNSGDTLFGQVDYRGEFIMTTTCKFKNAQSEVTEFSPGDLFGYRFTDGKYYISREVEGRKVFLEYLIKGKVNIYYMRDDMDDHYFIDKEGQKMIEIQYEEGIKLIDDKLVNHKTKAHIGILRYYMQDTPELHERINAIDKPKHQSLIEIAEDYHNMVCDDEKCIIYEKKLPRVKIAISPTFGLTRYGGVDNFVSEAGGYLYFWLPRSSEKLFLKTGLLYSNILTDGMNVHIYRYPIQLIYLYRAFKLQPHLSAGINFTNTRTMGSSNLSHTLCLNPGLNYQITKRISLSSTLNTDYTSWQAIALNDNVEFGLTSYTMQVGLFIEF